MRKSERKPSRMEVPFSEQLEEGEIVDDDQTFELISDDSIIDCTPGKLAPTKDRLGALSLSSSASGTDGFNNKGREDARNKQHHRRKRRNVRHHHHDRKARHKPSAIAPLLDDSSDEDPALYTHGHIKRKLKEAIHISGNGAESRKSLQSRLKLLGWDRKPEESDSTNEQLPEAPPPPVISQEAPNATEIVQNNKVDDSELENLRLEALKTAIMNKVARRKRRKALQLSLDKEKDVILEDKENESNEVAPSKDVEETSTKKPCLEQNTDENTTPNKAADVEDVDEDILRAELLRNMAKKITKTLPVVEKTPPLPPAPVNPVKIDVVSARMRSVQTVPALPAPTKSTRLVKKPQVPVIIKPLIIQVNKDSDSDSDVIAKVAPPIARRKIISDEKIDEFLQEQWAQWKSGQVEEKSDILEKSAVKLLPQSQQLEYRLLLRKLKNAERKSKVKRLQKTKIAGKADAVLQRPKAVERIAEVVEERSESVEVAPVSVDASTDTDELSNCGMKVVTRALTLLRNALKDMRTPRNDGSLQVKSVYQVLTPIMRKITQTSNERKKHEKRIRDLTRALDEARTNLADSHEKISTLVDEFVAKKTIIDSSSRRQPSTDNSGDGGSTTLAKQPLMTSTPMKVDPPCQQLAFDDCAISSLNQSDRNSEDMDICNSTSEEAEAEPEIDIVDPNDIDQIFTRNKQFQLDKAKVPEYISPLNYYVRYKNVDPHGIMCPYEVNGSCRDTECSFKHYLKGD